MKNKLPIIFSLSRNIAFTALLGLIVFGFFTLKDVEDKPSYDDFSVLTNSKHFYLPMGDFKEEILEDPKVDKCLIYGGIGVDVSKTGEGYVVKGVIKKSPADKILRKGDIIKNDISIFRGRVGDPAKITYLRKVNILQPPIKKTALLTLKSIKRCYLK